jgi:hypothetical protein
VEGDVDWDIIDDILSTVNKSNIKPMSNIIAVQRNLLKNAWLGVSKPLVAQV